MQAAGLDERGAIDYLVRYHDMYEKNPVGYLQAAIQVKGITPQQLFPELAGTAAATAQSQPAAEDEWVDPYVQKVTQKYDTELAAVKGVVQSLVEAQQQSATTQKQQMLSSLEDVVSDFAQTADDAGNPTYPHIETVFESMLHLMNTHPSLQQIPPTRAREKLEKAYEMAVHIDPELRQKMIDGTIESRMAQERNASEAERKARENADAVAKAKRATTARPSPGANAPGVRPAGMSIREAATHAVREHYRG
jgi:hypothetical protein